ncbi:hypothetical protein [Methanobrevibacter sp.]|uniref:hypothetical protein n=1 Tax=Methanobrevibacter sp. TaxID=66852 RepID=UPI0038686E2D
MKEFYAWVILFLFILLLILFKIDSATNYHNLVMQYQQNKEMYEKKTKELEKEIRILKADVYVLQYGYETGVEE